MKKYHVASGDGKGYYGVNYESYREAKELLKISQRHDPQAHIIEEEYHFTNADRIRAMTDAELAKALAWGIGCIHKAPHCKDDDCAPCYLRWLRMPAEEDE